MGTWDIREANGSCCSVISYSIGIIVKSQWEKKVLRWITKHQNTNNCTCENTAQLASIDGYRYCTLCYSSPPRLQEYFCEYHWVLPIMQYSMLAFVLESCTKASSDSVFSSTYYLSGISYLCRWCSRLH